MPCRFRNVMMVKYHGCVLPLCCWSVSTGLVGVFQESCYLAKDDQVQLCPAELCTLHLVLLSGEWCVAGFTITLHPHPSSRNAVSFGSVSFCDFNVSKPFLYTNDVQLNTVCDDSCSYSVASGSAGGADWWGCVRLCRWSWHWWSGVVLGCLLQ